MSKKIIAYGMDGFITPMMKYFADEGVLPTFKRMLDEGAANETFPSFPVWTPTNWATLSTGAHTGTHSVSRWRVEVGPGERASTLLMAAPTMPNACGTPSSAKASKALPCTIRQRIPQAWKKDM